jgi:hypothetical protein
MSWLTVLDELGSDGSSERSSMHRDEQGELGVTCSATRGRTRQSIASRSAAALRDKVAMMSETKQRPRRRRNRRLGRKGSTTSEKPPDGALELNRWRESSLQAVVVEIHQGIIHKAS